MSAEYSFSDAVFTYAVSPHPIDFFPLHCPIWNGAMCLSYTAETDVQQYWLGNREITIIGLCVDAHGEAPREEICKALLESPHNMHIDELYRKTNRLAGKYIVLYSDDAECYIFGDATGSLAINYCFDGDAVYAASSDQIVGSILQLHVSDYYKKIRAGTSLTQGLPNDMTRFANVYTLLPNHYLNITSKCAIRVPMEPMTAKTGDDYREIVKRSVSLINCAVMEYLKRYELVCPLTSGYDSRVVFSFLKKAIPNLKCYTLWHPGFTSQTGDLAVPLQICEDYKVDYKQIHDYTAPEGYIAAIKEYAGGDIDPSTVNMAFTIQQSFSGKAIINGDIIGQVGKALIGNALPTRYATPRFFQCKIHNCEPRSRSEIEKYLDGIQTSGCYDQVFDLFAIENRCGRWAAQGGAIYSLASVPSLNIFNSRELILLWMGIPRMIRVKNYLHKSLLESNDSRLLKYPFNPSDKMAFIKKNPYAFLMATHLKLNLQYLIRILK